MELPLSDSGDMSVVFYLLYSFREQIEKRKKCGILCQIHFAGRVCTMEKESKNIEILIQIMSKFMGKRLIKQILCVVLLIFGVDEMKIISGLNISSNTLKKYTNLLKNDRLSELFEDNLYRPKSELEDFREEIMTKLDENPAHT